MNEAPPRLKHDAGFSNLLASLEADGLSEDRIERGAAKLSAALTLDHGTFFVAHVAALVAVSGVAALTLHGESSMLAWLVTLSAVLGATFGSFLNVVIYRLPAENLSIVRSRSHCPCCFERIPLWLNVPILSWLLLKGRRAFCETPISARYVFVEVVTALLFALIAHSFGPSAMTAGGWLLASGLIVVTFIDLDIWEIPDEISLPGIVLGALLHPLMFPEAAWYGGLLGAILGYGLLALVRWLFYALRGVEGMGLGDLKLLAMIGAFLGPVAVLPVFVISSAVGAAVGIFVLLRSAAVDQDGDEEDVLPNDQVDSGGAQDEADEDDWYPPPNAVPFGPFLALGALVYLFLGAQIEAWLSILSRALL